MSIVPGFPRVVSSGRRPRCVLKIAGKIVSALSITIDSRTHFEADRFTVSLEPWSQPEGFGMAYWADAKDVQAELFGGFLLPGQDVSEVPGELTQQIVGQVDDVDIDPLDGTLHISGRDLSAKLIDSRTSEKFPDQTASQIVTKLATDAGLTPEVTDTSTPAGEYYNNSYAALGREIPVWDLMTFLAQQEGFDLYVSGSTLFFGPAPQNDETLQIAVRRLPSGQIQSNARNLHLRRSLTLAKDLTVTVLSTNVMGGSPVRATARRQGVKANTSSATTSPTSQNYTIRRPGLTEQQAQQAAESMLADLSLFERTMEATMEADTTLSVRQNVVLSGTDSSFDQTYYIDRISRKYKFGGGFEMTVSAKNHPTDSQPAL